MPGKKMQAEMAQALSGDLFFDICLDIFLVSGVRFLVSEKEI
jgi:hypothetical protein